MSLLVKKNGNGAVDSVNGKTGVVVIDADDISDASTVKKFISGVAQIFTGLKTFSSTLKVNNSGTGGVTLSSNASDTGLITADNLSPANPTTGISEGTNFGFNSSPSNFFGMGLAAIRNSAYDIWFQTGNNNGGGYRFYKGINELVTISKDGDVGIDAPNPIEKLDIDGKASSSFMRMCNNNTGRLDNEGLYIGVAGTSGEGYIGTRHNKALHFRTNQTDALFIDINQNVGMNTTTPQAKLDVNGYIKSKQSNVWAYISTPSATIITTASTYYPIQGTFVNDMIDFSSATVVTPGIKYDGTLTRKFKIIIQGQVSADSSNTTVTLGIKKNGTLISGSEISTICRVSNEPYHIGSVVMVELEEDDEIQLVATTDGSGDEVTFDNLQTLIEPI